LGEIGLSIGAHLVRGEHRARRITLGRIADLGGRIANHQHRQMAQVLESPEAFEWHAMTNVQVGASWVDTELDSQWSVAREE